MLNLSKHIKYFNIKIAVLSTLSAIPLLSDNHKAAATTILARCGPSTGQSYYFEGGFVGPGQGGWKKDGFDGGRIIVIVNDQDKIDLIIRDTVDFRSYLSEGNKIALVNFDEKSRAFIIAAHGAGFSESFLFKINEFGVGTVVWSAQKISVGAIRSSIMQAECGPQFEMKK